MMTERSCKEELGICEDIHVQYDQPPTWNWNDGGHYGEGQIDSEKPPKKARVIIKIISESLEIKYSTIHAF
jgi:hypothetical protein